MKSKIYLLWSLALVFLLSFNACKPKESAYKAAYEAAKAKEVQEDQVREVTPVSRPIYNDVSVSNESVQREKITVVEGNGIMQYSVVIGSFLNKTNAESLKERMSKQGFQPILAQNANGMYRVIVATFSDKNSAVTEKERVKTIYDPYFQDAWILDNQ